MNIRSRLSSWREYLTPISHTSTFRQTGEITPDEFIQAGDYLVDKFPTWAWGSVSPSKCKDFLPADKQYLVTKHVPSHIRASSFDGGVNEGVEGNLDQEVEDEEGWTSTFNNWSSNHRSSQGRDQSPPQSSSIDIGGEQDIDIGLEEEDLEEEDTDAVAILPYSNSALGQSSNRAYNLYIAYSTSYRVPKMYLSGFNADGAPLSPEQMFEDIIGEYKQKTVTIEKAPFLEDITVISIHPCRHANVMKVLLDRTAAKLKDEQLIKEEDVTRDIANLGLADKFHDSNEDEWEEVSSAVSDVEKTIRVDQYLVVFLKFISSVTPGIEHDYTMSAL
ncbi:hypothetical protein NADFUDRAFT_24471 [Nadsonia fulvescens var. elongata DSM 6958]|uniref:Autophagy-related protein 3 n=1 Tax=Nadsonia fulvescens var. elongata DSM 6958 TaxID=857566 RepID=A0A1E3PK38_9ASCO|nr:hypothetical protein NADFUDRAFT_24471 [Nadsonia fulvescens var. elongata DSM 6958]